MKILLVRLSSFGDVVFTLPLAHALRRDLGAEVHWAIETPLAPLVAGSADVAGVVHAPTRLWRKAPLSQATRDGVRALLASLRALAPDVVVDAQGLFKSALVTFAAPAGRKVGFGRGSATELVNTLVTDEHVAAPRAAHVVDRGLLLARHLTGRGGHPRVPDVSHLVARPDPEVDGWLAGRVEPFVLVQPFSSRADKEWPAGPLAELCRRLLAEDGLLPVLRWGPGERERVDQLARLVPGALVAPPTGPAATARLAARAVLFVGPDTGPTHLAAAAGTPTVALYGPTDPSAFGPVGTRVRILRDAGAYNPPAAGLGGIHVDDVLRAARSLRSTAEVADPDRGGPAPLPGRGGGQPPSG